MHVWKCFQYLYYLTTEGSCLAAATTSGGFAVLPPPPQGAFHSHPPQGLLPCHPRLRESHPAATASYSIRQCHFDQNSFQYKANSKLISDVFRNHKLIRNISSKSLKSCLSFTLPTSVDISVPTFMYNGY